MTTQDAIDYYGGKKIDIAKALRISPAAVTMWGDKIPLLRQYQLEKLTNGKLKAELAAA